MIWRVEEKKILFVVECYSAKSRARTENAESQEIRLEGLKSGAFRIRPRKERQESVGRNGSRMERRWAKGAMESMNKGIQICHPIVLFIHPEAPL